MGLRLNLGLFSLLLLFIPVLYIGFSYQYIFPGASTESWSQTFGIIQNSEIREEGAEYIVDISYNYSVNGLPYIGDKISVRPNSYESLTEAEAKIQIYFEGNLVTVYYNPNDPAESVLEKGVPQTSLDLLRGGKITLYIMLLISCSLLFPEMLVLKGRWSLTKHIPKSRSFQYSDETNFYPSNDLDFTETRISKYLLSDKTSKIMKYDEGILYVKGIGIYLLSFLLVSSFMLVAWYPDFIDLGVLPKVILVLSYIWMEYKLLFSSNKLKPQGTVIAYVIFGPVIFPFLVLLAFIIFAIYSILIYIVLAASMALSIIIIGIYESITGDVHNQFFTIGTYLITFILSGLLASFLAYKIKKMNLKYFSSTLNRNVRGVHVSDSEIYSFTHFGNQFFLGNKFGELIIWDNKKDRVEIKPLSDYPITDVSVFAKSMVLGKSNGDIIVFQEIDQLNIPLNLNHHKDLIVSIHFTNEYLVSTDREGKIAVWSLNDFSIVHRIDLGCKVTKTVLNKSEMIIYNYDGVFFHVLELENFEIKKIEIPGNIKTIEYFQDEIYCYFQENEGLMELRKGTIGNELVKLPVSNQILSAKLMFFFRDFLVIADQSGNLVFFDLTNNYNHVLKFKTQYLSVTQIMYIEPYLYTSGLDGSFRWYHVNKDLGLKIILDEQEDLTKYQNKSGELKCHLCVRSLSLEMPNYRCTSCGFISHQDDIESITDFSLNCPNCDFILIS